MAKDQSRITTDPVLLQHLEKQGIDPARVDFIQDYASAYVNGKKVKGRSPYAKFYRDRISHRRFAVISGLPMVRHDGLKVVVGWDPAGEDYISKLNLFDATVSGTAVTFRIINDQPDGRKTGEIISWRPELKIGGLSILLLKDKADLLDTDPLNDNYRQNTLEWDYGVCKRRLRIIEGRFKEQWVFDSAPVGDIEIKHNLTGKMRIGAGRDANGLPISVLVDKDIESVKLSDLKEAAFPVYIEGSDTFYPDADPESTTVDGYVYRFATAPPQPWDTFRYAAGTGADPSGTTMRCGYQVRGNGGATWARYIFRLVNLFDTSSLPDHALFSSVVLSLYGESKIDEHPNTPDFNIYYTTPASNDDLVAADYNIANWGATPYATTIAYADWSITGYNAFTISNYVAINKQGISKLGMRTLEDATGDEPLSTDEVSEYSYIKAYSADKGTGYKPKLVIDYTEPDLPVCGAVSIDSPADGSIRCTHGVWATCWAGGGSISIQELDTLMYIQTSLTASYWIGRGMLVFDLSGVSLSVSSAKIRIKCQAKAYDAPLDIYIVEGKHVPPLTAADYQGYALVQSSLGTLNLADIVEADWNDFELNAAGIAIVEAALGGFLYLGIRTANDAENSAPGLGTNTVNFYSGNSNGNEPMLCINCHSSKSNVIIIP